MIHWLIGVHAFFGEVGSLSYLWVSFELLNPSKAGMVRARWLSLIGLIFLLIAWMVGGFYYLGPYQSSVKPILKAGPYPWAHVIGMETKEHIFLFLPFVAFFVFTALAQQGSNLINDGKSRIGLLVTSTLLFTLGMSMAGFGYLITCAYRVSLELGILK